jgi:hypothetical protein
MFKKEKPMNTIIVCVVLAILATLIVAAATAAKAVPELPPERKLTREETVYAWSIIQFVLHTCSSKRNLVIMAHEAGCVPLSHKLNSGELRFSHLCGVDSHRRPGQRLGMVLVDRDGKEALTLAISILRNSYDERVMRLEWGYREV